MIREGLSQPFCTRPVDIRLQKMVSASDCQRGSSCEKYEYKTTTPLYPRH